MLTRKLIYNIDLEVVAAIVLIEPDVALPTGSEHGLMLSFLRAVQSEILSRKRFKQHLICPMTLKPGLTGVESSLQSAVTYYPDSADASQEDWQVGVIDNEQQLASIGSKTADTWMIDSSAALSLPVEVEKIAGKGHLIFTNVESYIMFEQLKSLQPAGVEGCFIEMPEKDNLAEKVSGSKQTVLNLIFTLTKANVPLDEVAEVIKSDDRLSTELLRTLNSPAYRGLSELSSIHDAVVRFGLNNVKQWAMILSMSTVSQKPMELLRLALLRATMCENLAETLLPSANNSDIAYTVGLLSTLNVFIDCAFEGLFEASALKEDIRQAILEHRGPLGKILSRVVSFQHGEIAASDDLTMMRCYVDTAREVNKAYGTFCKK